jgi:hypothetical protein
MKSVSFWEQLLIAEALRFVGENWQPTCPYSEGGYFED